jgi:phosphopantothenoylcysteine decarboxylase/phosphopantothenate--cysteine ligase
MIEKEISLLRGRGILLGVTGSIAAFKAAELASKLTQAGADVDCILTASAQRFVTTITFQALTGRRAFVDADLWSDEGHILHVGLAQTAELMVIAPATADMIAKLAHGRADTLLAITALAATCPMIVAPAMDAGMFEHAATQANIATLRERGVTVVGPVEGRMASGLTGLGRMTEPMEIVGNIRLVLGQGGSLAGRKIVITAGGTQEPLDPVRVLANRSSGKQGFAMVQAALDRGAEVTLISAPSHEITAIGAVRIDVQTAEEMSRLWMMQTRLSWRPR